MKRPTMTASFATAGLLTCAVVALAQTPPSDPNPNPNQPPRPRQPAPPSGQQPPPRQQPEARPGAGLQSGYMETPKYAQRLDTTLSQNAIQACVDNDFKGEQTTIENVGRTQHGTLTAFPANFDNSITSLRWNLEPGVLVVFFEDDTGKGQQLALWGKGQIPDLGKCDFNETASRWACYNIGGGAQPRSAGDMQLPHGAQPIDSAVSSGVIDLFDDQKFVGEHQRINGMTGIKAGDLHTLPEDKENAASSLRWNLPEGVIVIFAAEDGGNDNLVIFGEGQNPDLGQCDFDNKASRWSWAYIGSPMKDSGGMKPRDPNDMRPRDPNNPNPRDPNNPNPNNPNPSNPNNPNPREPDQG
jgi:hypothetical protein